MAELDKKINEITVKCPECNNPGYIEKDSLGIGFRMCSKCGQEWWTHIDYTKPITDLDRKISQALNSGDGRFKAVKQLNGDKR